VTITTDAWKGVSSAGATLTFSGAEEGSVPPDAAVTLAQPTIPIYAAAGDFAASIEVLQDFPGIADEIGTLFGTALSDNMSNFSAVGSGSSCSTGLFTAMQNQTTSPAHVTVHTAGTLAAGDIRAAYAALPARYQLNASWLMSPSTVQAVAALAGPSVSNGLAPHDYVPGSPAGSARLLGRPVLVSQYAPAFTSSTGTVNWVVVGDMSRFLVVNRIGPMLDLVEQLPDFAGGTGRPTGQRAYFYQARWGSNAVDVQAFRLLSNS